MLSRFLPSLFVGTPVAIKAMMGDSCDQAGQAKAMTVFSLGHGIGSVLGEPSKHSFLSKLPGALSHLDLHEIPCTVDVCRSDCPKITEHGLDQSCAKT